MRCFVDLLTFCEQTCSGNCTVDRSVAVHPTCATHKPVISEKKIDLIKTRLTFSDVQGLSIGLVKSPV